MARRSLKPQLNQIRAWVRQGRTDAWIAHQLEVSASELREFRKQHDLAPDGEDAGGEVDLRDEIEAEIEAATAEEEAEDEVEDERDEADEDEEGEEEGEEEKPARKARDGKSEDEGGEEKGRGEKPKRRRRRGRRGGRGRRKEIEATFDHGERDGYGLWLDASVKDNPVYKEHWAGKRDVSVRIDADQIVIRRAGESDGAGSDE